MSFYGNVINYLIPAQDGEGISINNDGRVDLNIKFNKNLVDKGGKKYLQILDKDNESDVIAEFDTTEFIKDGMLHDVSYDAASNTLTFTWNTDGDGKTDTVVLFDVDTNTVTTIFAGENMGEITDNGTDGNHAYVIKGKDWSGEIAAVDTGVMSVSGKDAISVTGDTNPEVSLLLDNSGNVALSQSTTGLKAEVKYGLAYDSSSKQIQIVENGDQDYVDIDNFIVNNIAGSSNDDITVSVDESNVISATLNKNYKTTQKSFNTDSIETGGQTSLVFITDIQQNENGEITARKAEIGIKVDGSDIVVNGITEITVGDGIELSGTTNSPKISLAENILNKINTPALSFTYDETNKRLKIS